MRKLSERNVYTDDYFLQDSCDRAQILARIFQDSCKIFLLEIEHSFLQESHCIQESCKN